MSVYNHIFELNDADAYTMKYAMDRELENA